MEIHEPFSDLEKQISDMLDQLNKQEPLSTAACKQVVAGLETINQSIPKIEKGEDAYYGCKNR